MMGELLRRLAYLWNRGRIERELEEEMAEHRRQMGDPRAFGSVLRVREEAGDAWGWVWLDQFAQDCRYAVRGLLRSPAYAISSILVLTVGLGLNLALFRIIETVVLQPDAIRDPATLVRLTRKFKEAAASSTIPYPVTQYVRQHNTVFSAVLTQTGGEAAWGDNAADLVRVRYVSANIFDELGYGAAEGRVFHEALDENVDSSPVAVLSHAFWVRRFGGAVPAVGQTIRLNNRPVTLIGVAPAEFPGLRPEPVDVFVPIHHIGYINEGSDFLTSWKAGNTELYARLKRGVSLEAIPAGLSPILLALAKERPDDVSPGTTFPASPGTRRFLSDHALRETYTRSALSMALTIGVLVVACANLANLMLARTQDRMAELTLRAAIGAGRFRLVRQLVTETLAMCAAGVALGWCVCRLILDWVRSHPDAPPSMRFDVGWMSFVAAAFLCLVTVALAGLLPAWAATRRGLLDALRAGTAPAPSRGWLQRGLMATQVTGGCALILLAGLWVSAFQRILSNGPGYDFRNVAVLDPSLHKYGLKGEEARAFWDRTLAILAGRPGLEAAALSSHAPLGMSMNEGEYVGALGLKVTSFRVQPGFFSLMRIPLLAGRNFEPGDDPRTVVILGKRLAERMYGGANPVGKGFPPIDPQQTVIGVAAETRLIKLTASNTSSLYEPLAVSDHIGCTLLMRFHGDPKSATSAARAAARQADSRVFASTSLLTDNLERTLSPYRLLGMVLTAVGLMALALASLGIFGLVAYSVSTRTREIGIRRALGAPESSLLASVLRQTAGPVAAGVALGCGCGLVLARAMSGEPFYLDASDLAGAGASMLAVVVAVAMACLWPAQRALRVDLVKAIRQE